AAGLDAAGRLVAWTHRIAGTPLRLKFGPLEKGIDESLVDGAVDLPYAIPNLLVDQATLELAPVPRGPWRSVGVSHNGFVTEGLLDEVAGAARRDPFERRRGGPVGAGAGAAPAKAAPPAHARARGAAGRLGYTAPGRPGAWHRARRV